MAYLTRWLFNPQVNYIAQGCPSRAYVENSARGTGPMQRVAALYDIHGNLPALEAVLAEVRDADVEALVVGGDVIPGPMPRECLDLLNDTGIPTRFIHGNGESAALEARGGGALAKVPEAFREGIRWSASQLPDESVAQIAEWPPTTQLEVDGLGKVLFCHATPHSDTEIFTR